MIYIDVPGLSRTNGAAMADLLELGETAVRLDNESRLATLARLREGAGATVITGPEGKEFWLLASREVDIKVEPDGYVMKERCEEDEWSYRAVGITGAEYGQLSRRKSAPTETHRLYAQWQSAARLRSELPRGVTAEVTLDWEAQTLTVTRAAAILTTERELLALDWEWNRETFVPFDLGICGAEGPSVVHITNPADVDAMRWAVGSRQRKGLSTVWHGGRADLGKQHDRDPEELIDTPPHDSQVMAYLAGEPDLHLKNLTRNVLKRQVVAYDGDLESLSLDHRRRYCAADVRNSFDLYHLYSRRLAVTGQTTVYEDIERPLMPLIASMERGGMPVDMGVVQSLRADSYRNECAMRSYFIETWGLDPDSDEETRGWVTSVIGFDPGTLDQRILSWYPQPEIDLLLFYRRTRTHRRSFLDKTIKLWETAGRPSEFRIYPSFNQAGDPEEGRPSPRSGRLSSSGEMNAQNQPGDLKVMYVPPEGHDWWDYDYSGIELRVAAAVSGDATMLRAMREGLDLHNMLRDRVEANTGIRPARVVAKRWNFGKLYGAQLDKLIEILASVRVFVDRPTALAMETATGELFPRYPQWAKNVVRKATKDGYSVTWWGRRRYIPELQSNDASEKAYGANAAVNHVVQGSAADLIKMSMVRLAKVGRQYGAHTACSVHDAIGGYVPSNRSIGWDKTARSVMQSFKLIDSVPMLVEGKTGRSWGDCHA